MFWRVGILTMLLAWMLPAAPAAAGVQRHTDSRGVIHISNNSPTSSVQSPRESSNSPIGVVDPVRLPASSEPPLAGAAKPTVAATPESSPPAPSPEPARGQTPPIRPESPGIAAAPEMGANAGGPLPVQKVAWNEDEAGPGARPAPRMTVPGQPERITSGGIQRFRDRQGTLHITNVQPGREDSGSGLLQAKTNAGLGEDFPAAAPGRTADVSGALPLQSVSWSPDNPGSIDSPAAAPAAGLGEPALVKSIHYYRDSRGVIHINNAGATAGSISPLPLVQARAGPEEERGPPPETRPPPGEGAAVPSSRQPGDRTGKEVLSPPAALISAPFGGPETALLGGIRRHRDRQGVWHLETAPAPGLPEPPPLPSLSELGRKLTLAGINPAPAPAMALGTFSPVSRSLSGPGRSYGGITVSRDFRGRLTITNAQPPAGVGQGLAVVEARAQLEPIIQEAARTYALPPTLIRAVIKAESNFASWAVSPKGAMGLMQLMPGTAAFLGVQEPFNPRENIFGGCRYLRLLIDSFGGSLHLALAGYNAGYQRVVDCGYRVPDIKETQAFLTQVMGDYLAEERKALLPRI